MLENNFYIYRHIRPDTNEVFYIGKSNNLDKRLKMFRRAYLTQDRTAFWNNIVQKNKGVFLTDILFCCDTEKEINEKEKEFIALYGRKDLGKGTLVNLTDGGEGAIGVLQSAETIAKRSGKNHYHYQGIMERKKENARQFLHNRKVIDTATNTIYKNASEAAVKFGINRSLMCGYLSGTKTNKTTLCWLKDFESGNHKINQPKKKQNGSGRLVIDLGSGVFYESIAEAAQSSKYKEVTIRKMLNGVLTNKTNLRLADGL